MSDGLDEIEREVAGWQPPARDIQSVVRRGRTLAWVRRAFTGGLTLITLVSAITIYGAVRDRDSIQPASSDFELIDQAANFNGVDLEPTEVDASWDITRADASKVGGHGDSLLPSGPMSVLVTSERLNGGIQGRRAWADVIDGYRPGPIIDADNAHTPRVYLTLTFMDNGVVFLPVAPPHESWGENDVTKPVFTTAEPWPLWADLEWEGVGLAHPANWRRVATGYDPGGSVTEIATLSISNVDAWPVHGEKTDDGYDMSRAPRDAVVVEVSHYEGGPVVGDCLAEGRCDALPPETEEDLERVDDSGGRTGVFYVGRSVVWFWLGPDASQAEEAAFERIRASFSSTEPSPDDVTEKGRCSGRKARPADVDGDGVKELVYHAWVRGAAQVGVCFAGGRSFTMPGLGQAESLFVLREEGVGRDVIVFGTTGITETTHRLAIWKGRLRLVKDARTLRPLEARAGVDETGVAWAWGWNCDRVGAPGTGREVHGTLVQAKVSGGDKSLSWVGRGYVWRDQVFAINDSTRKGSADSGEPLDLAKSLLEDCAPPSG